MSGTSAGVGFAIPSSTVLKIVPQLIQLGRVRKITTNEDIKHTQIDRIETTK
jgi:S1-C subfamily serine protease